MRLGRELLESREVVKLVEFKLARDTPKGRQSDRVGAGFDRTSEATVAAVRRTPPSIALAITLAAM